MDIFSIKKVGKMKVYITNKSSHNYSDAKRYGELVFLSEGAINKYNTSQMVRQFKEVFKDSLPDDYFLPTSLNIMNCIAAALLAIQHKKVNFLLYSSKGYIVRQIDFTNISIKEKE